MGSPVTSRRDELLVRLAASPDARDRDEGLRVYADQLIERGDPFGELIVVALERVHRDTPELARREAELIALQEQGLDERLTRDLRQQYRWQRGFLDALELDYAGDERFEILPGLAAEPAACLLRRLQITALQMDGKGDMAPIIAELASLAAHFPCLSELAIHEGANLGNPWIDGPININDVTPLYAAFPRLEVLELDGDAVKLGAIDLPCLRRFMTKLRVADLRAIVGARWPRIEELELSFDEHLVDNVAATFGPLLYRDFGPTLVALAIRPPRAAERYLVDELADCPLARHVRRLAFVGELEQPTLEALIAQAPRLRRLEQLKLFERPIAASMRLRLRGAFGNALQLW